MFTTILNVIKNKIVTKKNKKLQREEITTFQVKSSLRYTLCVANKTQRVPTVIKQINTMKCADGLPLQLKNLII